MFAYQIWGVYAPACCPADIEGQIADKFGEKVTVISGGAILMDQTRVGAVYQWEVA